MNGPDPVGRETILTTVFDRIVRVLAPGEIRNEVRTSELVTSEHRSAEEFRDAGYTVHLTPEAGSLALPPARRGLRPRPAGRGHRMS